jgi:hypothetical protein
MARFLNCIKRGLPDANGLLVHEYNGVNIIWVNWVLINTLASVPVFEMYETSGEGRFALPFGSILNSNTPPSRQRATALVRAYEGSLPSHCSAAPESAARRRSGKAVTHAGLMLAP